MMIRIDWKKSNALVLAGFLALTASLGLLPVAAATAQVRTLPDFTDLVEQVGPSVVNIRTLEKVAARDGLDGSVDEQMLEFFRRFGLPIPGFPNTPNQPRQGPPRNHPPIPEESHPRGVGSGFILSTDG